MQAILKERVKSPEKLNASIPKALGDIIMKALEKIRPADAKMPAPFSGR